MEILISLGIGYLLDLILGDPYWLPHPVQAIGWLISNGEKAVRKMFPKHEFFAGAFLTIWVIVISFLVPFFLLWLLAQWNIYVKIGVEAFFCYQILATKSLRVESMYVYHYLVKHDMINARKFLSRIVGRDTEHLNQEQITKAVVETIAENTSDGVVAPMLFLAIGGAPLGFLYKAVNTLDSMIGYKNDRYLFFGRFAAKLDDIVNFLPAIFSAYSMILASALLRMDTRNAVKIYRRDRKKHASPNSAKTESVAAGALRVQLAGDAYYFGKLVKKETIGDPIQSPKIDDIRKMNRLMYVTSIISFLFLIGVRGLVVALC